MPNQPYDETGALGGLFAPAFIRGNPESEAAVAQWQAENFAVTPEMIEASRGPSTTVPTSGVTGGLRAMPGSGTMTIPGSVDPEALRIYAQGGKYTPKPKPPAPSPPPAAASGTMTPDANAQRDAITNTLLSIGRVPNAAMMGEGDNRGYIDPDPFRIIPGGA